MKERNPMKKSKLLLIQILIPIFLLLNPSFAYAQPQDKNILPLFALGDGFLWLILTSILSILVILSMVLHNKNKKLRAKTVELHIFNELRKNFINADDRLIYLKDENLKYVFVNTAFEQFYNIDDKDIIGKDDFTLSNHTFANLRRKTDLDVLVKGTRIIDQVQWKGRIFRTNKFPIKLLNGSYGVGAYIEDISKEVKTLEEKKEQFKRIQYLSYYDPLTGLHNRNFFFEEMRRLDTKENLPISIIMGDVDGLKLTNDIFGHAAGDRLLKKVAMVLKQACRKEDIVARMGGDEFVLLLPQTSLDQAEIIKQRIKEQYSKNIVKGIRGNISLGCDSKVTMDQSLTQVIENAEINMYTDKTLQGR